MEKASDFVGEGIPVVSEGYLKGVVTEGDLFNQVLSVQEELRNQ
jgi:CBS domain-containing protein